jgi:epoxyqueuosine reductase
MSEKVFGLDNMPLAEMLRRLSRRDLFKQAMAAAPLVAQDFQRARGGRGGRGRRVVDPSQIPAYKYKTLSVDRLPTIQTEYDSLRNNSQLSKNKAFRDQISPLNLRLPADFQNAKSVVVVAAYAKPMYANFRLNGQAHKILIPFQYYDEDLNAAQLMSIIQKDVIKTSGRRIVDITQTSPLKLLASRSGLGRYARNSLIFVDGMGSYNMLYAFLTDHPLGDEYVSNLSTLEECNHCHSCERSCPTRCISRWNFTVNIDKCLTLYNENPGEFPNFIYGSMHHALMGCTSCKSPCPANEGIAELSGNLGDVTEEETQKILQGKPDDALLKSLQQKLKGFRAAKSKELFPILTRNLGVLIRT